MAASRNSKSCRSRIRRRWIEAALAPLRRRLDAPTLRRLEAALCLLIGIDAIVVLKDIAGLEREEALDVLAWAADVLTSGALAGAAVPRG